MYGTDNTKSMRGASESGFETSFETVPPVKPPAGQAIESWCGLFRVSHPQITHKKIVIRALGRQDSATERLEMRRMKNVVDAKPKFANTQFPMPGELGVGVLMHGGVTVSHSDMRQLSGGGQGRETIEIADDQRRPRRINQLAYPPDLFLVYGLDLAYRRNCLRYRGSPLDEKWT